jgi:hypothetical protein
MQTPEWYTPRPFVDAARLVLGAIDLDPASNREANRIVRARRFYSSRGELRPWRGRIFINPPGGLVVEFWRRMMYEWAIGNLTAAIWIGYSIEQLQTLQGDVDDETPNPIEFPICVPRRRIPFVENEAKRLARLAAIDKENRKRRREGLELRRRSERAGSPSHANYVLYVGRARARFAKVFSEFGQVRP